MRLYFPVFVCLRVHTQLCLAAQVWLSALCISPMWIKRECQCYSIITLAQCGPINRSPSSVALAVSSAEMGPLLSQLVLGILMCSIHNVLE